MPAITTARAIEVLDSDLGQRLVKATDTVNSHHMDTKSGMDKSSIGHLIQVVDELTMRATSHGFTLTKRHIELTDETRQLVRSMQTIIEDKPADMVKQLKRLATDLHQRMTGQSSTPIDDDSLWVPDEYVERATMTYKERLAKQNATLAEPEDIKYSTNEPEFAHVGETVEPDEYDEQNSEDERNIVLTEANYPMKEYPIYFYSTQPDSPSSSPLQ